MFTKRKWHFILPEISQALLGFDPRALAVVRQVPTSANQFSFPWHQFTCSCNCPCFKYTSLSEQSGCYISWLLRQTMNVFLSRSCKNGTTSCAWKATCNININPFSLINYLMENTVDNIILIGHDRKKNPLEIRRWIRGKTINFV